ncbi:DNA repair protein RecN, partial [candidate division WOR-3 bacterium]|nr:DNA repair protein RecN [candidate division WOR-3 bacterium]MBD3363784.1 DNA repair protein RecN [candidate division WOR-3 bacterium]
ELYRSGEDRLEVEAVFTTQGLQLPSWVSADEDLLIIQRSAQKGKRPQNFVNQRQTTQQSLSELGDGLVDIHGQHQHQLLLRPSSHGQFLDAYGELQAQREAFSSKLNEYQGLHSRIRNLKEDLARRAEQKEFLAFQLEEIEKIDPKKGEIEELKHVRKLLASAEQRAELTQSLINLLSEQDESVLEKLSQANRMLETFTKLDPETREKTEPLRQAEVSVDEVWRALVDYREAIEYSPQRLEEINQRLFEYEKLCRKHNVDAKGLIDLAKELEDKLESIELDAGKIKELEAEEISLRTELIEDAGNLSQARSEVNDRFEDSVLSYLSGLAMPTARLVVEFIRTEDPEGLYQEGDKRYKLTDNGLESIQFMFSANPGEEPKPLNRIASGGEISRIMLALKTVLVKSDRIPVLVFDEIDVGIGGATAETIGKRLKELAEVKQILLVTHLPQIARYADTHFRITKQIKGKRTVTRIKKLAHNDRIEELARMLGGEEITETVRAHAAELLEGPNDP